MRRPAIGGGRLPTELNELTVEVRDVIEAHIEADLSHRSVRLGQKRAGRIDSRLVDEFREGMTRLLLKEARECTWAHSAEVSNGRLP